MHRNARAVAVGATAAVAYLAGSRLRAALPVRPGVLAVLATVGTAAVFNSHASAKAYEVENRLNDILANGFTVTGRIDMQGPGNLHMHGNNINLEGGTVVP